MNRYACALLIALSACATTTTPTASPCGEGAPQGCEEVVDRVCYVPEIPVTWASGHVLTDALVSQFLDYGPRCGFRGVTTCGAGQYAMRVSVGEDASVANGEVIVSSTVDSLGRVLVEAFDGESRARVGLGERIPLHRGEVCDVVWYGEREAGPCALDLLTLLDTTFPSCTDQVQCDYCACRVNTFNDITSPQCVQPPG